VCDQRIQQVIQHIHDSIVGEFPAEYIHGGKIVLVLFRWARWGAWLHVAT
jgi:hypothetical protein